MRVIPSNALWRYRGRKAEAGTVSEEVNVRAVLLGRVVFQSGNLLVSVELIDGAENRLLWGDQYRVELADVFAIQKDMAAQIARALRQQLTPEEEEILERQGTDSIEAYQAYLMGGHFLYRDLHRATAYFQSAIEKDPDYLDAFSGLGRSFSHLAWEEGLEGAWPQAKAAFEKVLELDSRRHWIKARLLAFYERDWEAAGEEWTRQLERNPSAGELYICYLVWMARYDEAVRQTELWLVTLDPLSYSANLNGGWFFYTAGALDRAIELARRTLELYPDSANAYGLLASSYALKGMREKAFEAFLMSEKINGKISETDMEGLKDGFREHGLKGYYLWKLDNDEGLKPYARASLYSLLGAKREAFEWLNKAYEYPLWQPCVGRDFDPIRGDARYEQLLRKLKLPQDVISRHLTRQFQ